MKNIRRCVSGNHGFYLFLICWEIGINCNFYFNLSLIFLIKFLYQFVQSRSSFAVGAPAMIHVQYNCTRICFFCFFPLTATSCQHSNGHCRCKQHACNSSLHSKSSFCFCFLLSYYSVRRLDREQPLCYHLQIPLHS